MYYAVCRGAVISIFTLKTQFPREDVVMNGLLSLHLTYTSSTLKQGRAQTIYTLAVVIGQLYHRFSEEWLTPKPERFWLLCTAKPGH
jgi:hypothetical protein